MNTAVLFIKTTEIQALYPESCALYAQYKKEIGCIVCKRRRLFKKLVGLVENLGARGDINSILNLDISKDITVFNRVKCENCVEKHLCQCYILLNEVQAGYTEHYKLAAAHYQEALEEGCGFAMTLNIDTIDNFKHILKLYLKLDEDTILLIGNMACAEDRLRDLGLNEEADKIREFRLNKVQKV